jgi:hypothetical protein
MSQLTDYPKAATELDEYIRQLADNENKQRDELSKRYSVDEKELEAYERGFSEEKEQNKEGS